jgi:hypothetical protein
MTENISLLDKEILNSVTDNKLSCSAAFEIAGRLNIEAKDIGEAADRLKIRLTGCQLGLFGHEPDKKTVKPLATVAPELKAAINKSLEDGKLTCIKAWEIDSQLRVRKFSVSCACEALKIKIRECQLGAF